MNTKDSFSAVISVLAFARFQRFIIRRLAGIKEQIEGAAISDYLHGSIARRN